LAPRLPSRRCRARRRGQLLIRWVFRPRVRCRCSAPRKTFRSARHRPRRRVRARPAQGQPRQIRDRWNRLPAQDLRRRRRCWACPRWCGWSIRPNRREPRVTR